MMTRRIGIPQDVDLKECQFLGPGDTFQFECQRCGSCCGTTEILLKPYDILQLCQHLRLSTSDFLVRYAKITIGPQSGLPICSLDLVRHRGCPFFGLVEVAPGAPGRVHTLMSRGGVKHLQAACRVYPAAPAVCRSFPMGRLMSYTDAPADELPGLPATSAGQDRYFVQPGTCLGARAQCIWTLEEWVETRDLARTWRESRRFDELVCHRLWQALQQRQDPPDMTQRIIELASFLAYDFDDAAATFAARCGAPIPTLGEACYEEGFRLLESLVDVLEQGEIPRHVVAEDLARAA